MFHIPYKSPSESWEQYIERTNMESIFRLLWEQLFIFLFLCGLLSMRWTLNFPWKWLLVVGVPLAAILKEYEHRRRQAFVEKYGVYPGW